MRCGQATKGLKKAVEKAVQKARKETQTLKLTERGVYTAPARALARILKKSGCSHSQVGHVIQKVGRVMGVSVERCMSRRTVGRVILEGGIAAKIQLGHEIKQSESLTMSSDSTMHRHVNIDAHHIALKVPSYSNPESEMTHKIRLFGIGSSVNHTSEAQVSGWKETAQDIGMTYSDSPLAKRNGQLMVSDDLIQRAAAVNTDHAPDQRKMVGGLKEWKEEAAQAALGTAQLRNSYLFFVPIIAGAVEEKIKEAGGPDAWDTLSPTEQAARDAAMMRKLSVRIGKNAFAHLLEEQQTALTQLLWAGCCMHKDLNSVKGGDKSMQAAWEELKLEPLVLLANKDNAATLELEAEKHRNQTDQEGEIQASAAEERAGDVSSRGGVKTTTLVGALVNHKDEKKGYHDSFRMYMFNITGKTLTFPDTSNTRYQSHCKVAAHLLKYLDEYTRFLEIIRNKKENRTFSHMEANIYMALHDIPTLTELAVLVLYAQAVTHPYMRVVRGPGTEQQNLLDLGLLHEEVKSHVKKLIENPDLLLAPDAVHESGSMDGRSWEDPEAITAVQALLPRLPHVKEILVAFLKGSLATWERFTMEFAPGGLIDLASATEKERAWMPTTNDANEGALGSYRLYARTKPTTTIHHYNAYAMYHRNETQSFMEAMFTDNDYAFIRARARRIDSSKLEAERRRKQAKFDKRMADMRQKKAEDRDKRKAEKAARTAKVVPILDVNLIPEKIKVVELDDQLDLFRTWDEQVPLKSRLGKWDQKIQALRDAIERRTGS
ncbi:hypothetical protein OF83DRAFT_1065825 [Amylostereum chailletii]|nr:hypothetical protein OF83DRAFT_1065825 [Amylostereum chailletii]